MTYLSSLLLEIPGVDHGFETSGNLTLPEGTLYCAQAHGTHIVDADGKGRKERPVADALFSRGAQGAIAATRFCAVDPPSCATGKCALGRT